jgi:hypothetical protein
LAIEAENESASFAGSDERSLPGRAQFASLCSTLKTPRILLLFLFAISAIAENSPPDRSLCGPFPKLYKEITWNWLEKNLVDANSAKIEWEGEPTSADLGKEGEHLYGWLVKFKINSRNRWGAYTGKQSHGVLIRDNQVIKGLGFRY